MLRVSCKVCNLMQHSFEPEHNPRPDCDQRHENSHCMEHTELLGLSFSSLIQHTSCMQRQKTPAHNIAKCPSTSAESIVSTTAVTLALRSANACLCIYISVHPLREVLLFYIADNGVRKLSFCTDDSWLQYAICT